MSLDAESKGIPTRYVEKPLSASIDRTLQKIKKDGFLELEATNKGVEVEFGHKFTKDWVVGAYASRNWDGAIQAGVRVKGAW
jgi:hypothetical protein